MFLLVKGFEDTTTKKGFEDPSPIYIYTHILSSLVSQFATSIFEFDGRRNGHLFWSFKTQDAT